MARKVFWSNPTNRTIAQEYRYGIEYAFLSKDNRQACPFIFCKDFLQDAMYAYLNGVRKEIYGFVYDPKIHSPLCTEKLMLLVTCSKDSKFSRRIEHCVDFLNQFERTLKQKLTKVTECANPPPKYKHCGVWLFEASRRWLIAPPMLSLYALLVRIGLAHKSGEYFETTIRKICDGKIPGYGGKDRKQLLTAEEGIDRILESGGRNIFYRNIYKNFPDYIPVKTMHHKFGIAGFSTGLTQQLIPYWHRSS